MKKLFLALVVSLALCGSTFAQTYETNWPGFNDGPYDFQTALVAGITINGQIINVDDANWDALEVVAFVGDEQRSYGMFLYDGYVEEYGDPFPIIDGGSIFYNDGGETVTFQMYDHLNGVLFEECTVTYLGEPYTAQTGSTDIDQGWWDPENPVWLNFVSEEPPTPGIVPWGDEWSEVPTIESNVEIGDDIVIIGKNVEAYANTINITGSGAIIILDGGQLHHNDEVEVTMVMNVDGYDSRNPGGYRLISAPINPDFTVTGTNLVATDYDLYKFDQGANLEWLNFKDEANNLNNTLVLGTGYLYARAETDSITFEGATISTETSMDVTLDKVPGKHWSGWNLVGNPYTCKAYLQDNRSFYRLVETTNGSEFIEATGSIHTMEGIFVEAEEDGEILTFTTTAPDTEKSSLNITVTEMGNLVDAATLCFGNGRDLSKIQLNPNHTKVYMPVEGKDFAMVHTGDQGEMPVNFKAEESGTYTMSFNNKNVEFSYLHLIDNMTGNDVDLLVNPNYTFDARRTDYASRFKLVYAKGNNNSDNFGFMNNGNLMILGIEGEATLQVIDVTGRILSSETFSGSYNKPIKASAGIYMISLIQGENVRTQKIVVK